MSERAITRRTLVLAGAGALAGAAARPGAASALGGRGRRPQLATLELGDLAAGDPRTLALPRGTELIGVRWRGPAGAEPRVRVRGAAGKWGPWVPAGPRGHGPAGGREAAQITGEPLWTGAAGTLQLQSAVALRGASLVLVGAGPAGSADGAQTASLQLAQPVLQAGAGQPPIIAREAWAQGVSPPRVAPEYGRVELGFVHHTDNPNGYTTGEVPAMLRAIWAFHRFGNGWNDIGYNFVIDLYGRIWEARAGGIDEPVVGAHAGGYNYVSSGIAVLGTFSSEPISSAARTALQRLLAWKLSLHGVPAIGTVTVRVDPAGASYSKYRANARVRLPRIAGHRDADTTDCPGDVLYGELPAVRGAVAHLAGTPVAASLALLPAPAVPEGAPAAPRELQASLAKLDGTPLASAQVQLQSRTVARRGQSVTETVLAEGLTDAQGLYTVPASFAAGAPRAAWVRALHPAGGATGAAVSAAVKVPPQPAPALTPVPGTTPSS